MSCTGISTYVSIGMYVSCMNIGTYVSMSTYVSYENCVYKKGCLPIFCLLLLFMQTLVSYSEYQCHLYFLYFFRFL